MRKKALILLIVAAFLVPIIDQKVNVNLAEANPHYQPPRDPGYIYIQYDGSITPASTPIHRQGNVFTLTSSITGHPIWIQYNGAVLYGAGYALKGNQSDLECGVTLLRTKNVMVKNLQVIGFRVGIIIQRQINGVPYG